MKQKHRRLKGLINFEVKFYLFFIKKTRFLKVFFLKGLLVSRDAIVDAHMKYLEEEIEIKIESLKHNLDKMLDAFKKDLNDIKTNELVK